MSEIGATSLSDLPSDPTAGGNVQISIQEQKPNPMSLDQTTISQIVNGLQQASVSGATRLPSSHIPMTQTHITTDNEARPNYIPDTRENKYINDSETYETYGEKSAFDKLYENIQFPLLLAVFFFIFQMPAFKGMIFTNIPSLFSSDGNYNFNGLAFTSIAFSLIYYFVSVNLFNQ